MLYYTVIVDTILVMGIIVFWFLNSVISGSDDQDQFLRMASCGIVIALAMSIMYDVGYYNAQTDLFYKIDHNKTKEIKNSVDYKKWKLNVQEAFEIAKEKSK